MENKLINNPNLRKLLETLVFEESLLSSEDPQSKDVKFMIPDNSCFGQILNNNQKVKDFLKEEDVKWQKLLNQKELQIQGALQTPAFADLARLLKTIVYSGVQNFPQHFDRYIVSESQDSKYLNNNGSVPTEYLTIASASKFSKNRNFRFGKSGLFFKPTCSFLFGKQDFCSAGIGDALDPRMAFQNYNENEFERKNLVFDLNSIAKSLSCYFYLDSTDPHLEDVREQYAKEKNKIRNPFTSFFLPYQQEKKLDRKIAESQGFARSYDKEVEYNEIHLPATVLLAEGFFSLDCLTENSLKQYEAIYNLKEFLSSNENITQSQLDIFKIPAADLLEPNGLELLKRKCLEIRSNFLENTAKYFQDITASHQKRVQDLIEKNQMEEAIVLALQSDYFQKLTTTEGIQQHLQNPLDIKIFNSKTKEVEDISQETVLPLIGKIDLVEKIIENDKVKAIDRESLKKIFKKADLREIIKYFTKDGETAFPAEAIDNDQVNFEKLLKIDNLQEFFKPFFDYCDEKLDNIKQKEKKIKFFTAPLFLAGISCIGAAIALPPLAPFAGLAVLVSATSVAIGLICKVSFLIKKEQLKELKEGRPEINKKQAFAKIVGKCYNSFTSYFIKQESKPATSLKPATIGAVEEEAVISI